MRAKPTYLYREKQGEEGRDEEQGRRDEHGSVHDDTSVPCQMDRGGDAPVGSVGRDGPRLGRRGDLDERCDEPPDAVQRGTEGVACAPVRCGERFGRVGVENAVHLFGWGECTLSHGVITTTLDQHLRHSWREERVSVLITCQEQRGRGGRKTNVQHETVRTRKSKHRCWRLACREQKHEDARQERESCKRELASTNHEPARAARKVDNVTCDHRTGDAEDRDDGVVAIGHVETRRTVGGTTCFEVQGKVGAVEWVCDSYETGNERSERGFTAQYEHEPPNENDERRVNCQSTRREEWPDVRAKKRGR